MSDDVEKVSEVFAERDALRARLEATEAALREARRIEQELTGGEWLGVWANEPDSRDKRLRIAIGDFRAALAALDKETQG